MAKVKDILTERKRTFFSLEVTPPDKGGSINDIFDPIDQLVTYHPQFINVTFHQPYVEYVEENNIIKRVVRSKKPGTVGISSAIQNRYGVDAVPHIVCGGQSRYAIEDTLIDLSYLGIENVFVVRGDPAPGSKKFIPDQDGYSYASELVESIAQTNFCIGVAGYPEKHSEALNQDRDILFLKEKVDKGADYIITQMSFDYEAVINFIVKTSKAGITVPIIPGIKPVTSMAQIEMIPRTFGINIPMDLILAIESAKTKQEEFNNGIKYMASLVQKLLDSGLPGIHLFTMGKGKPAKALLNAVFGESL